jgi:hypothetical protein
VHHRLAAFAVALTLVLAACGTTGDDEGDDTTTTTAATTESSESTESTESTTTTEPVDDDAQERAEAVDITLDDFPEGWESAPHEESDEEDLITTCSDFDLESLTIAEYFTDDFTLGDLSANDGQSIEIGTRVFEDEQTATDIVSVIPEDDFIACSNDELESSFGIGSVEGEVDDRVFTGIGDQTEGFSGQILVTDSDSGEQVPLTVAFVAIRTGDLVTGLSAVSVTQDLDSDVLDTLGERIVELQEG